MKTTLTSDIETLIGEQKIDKTPHSDATLTDMAAIGRSGGLGKYHILLLLLKHCAESNPNKTGVGKWPINLLHEALESGAKIDWPHERLQVCITEMTLMALHEVGIDSAELRFYEQEKEKAGALERAASEDVKCRYDRLHDHWLKMQAGLGEGLLFRENALVRREALRQEFMRRFGVEYLAERQQQMQVEVLQLKLSLLQESPDLTEDELEQLSAETVRRLRAQLDRDQRTLGTAFQPQNTVEPGATTADIEKLKTTLKRLWMLLHPDRLQHASLTDLQRGELAGIWDHCQSIKSSDIAGASVGKLFRSQHELERHLERAQRILSQAGIDIDTGLVVVGETLEERIEWLESAIAALTRELHVLHQELRVWRDDPELQCMLALSGMDAAAQETEKAAMQERAAALRTKAGALQQQIAAHIGGRHRG